MALASAAYNATGITVTLTTRKTLVLSPPLELTIKAAGLLDALGQPARWQRLWSVGHKFRGHSYQERLHEDERVELARTRKLSAPAVDALLAAGYRADFRDKKS